LLFAVLCWQVMRAEEYASAPLMPVAHRKRKLELRRTATGKVRRETAAGYSFKDGTRRRR
jgi:hypothetical protein